MIRILVKNLSQDLRNHHTHLFFLRRYADKSSVDLELEDFLVKAYKKQIKELNSSTGKPDTITK